VYNEKYQKVAKVIWRRPHRIRGESRDPLLIQLAPWVSTTNRTSISAAAFSRCKRVAVRQTHHATRTSVAMVRISCIRCGVKVTYKHKDCEVMNSAQLGEFKVTLQCKMQQNLIIFRLVEPQGLAEMMPVVRTKKTMTVGKIGTCQVGDMARN